MVYKTIEQNETNDIYCQTNKLPQVMMKHMQEFPDLLLVCIVKVDW
jgi:hypothetical protein